MGGDIMRAAAKLLQIAVEAELTASVSSHADEKKHFEDRLKMTLHRWQMEVASAITFATAFNIAGNDVRDQVPSVDSAALENALYKDVFIPLVLPPTQGSWPWNLMRGAARKDGKKGAFPPQLILIGKAESDSVSLGQDGWNPPYKPPIYYPEPNLLPDTRELAQAVFEEAKKTYQNDEDKASWYAYGVIPSLVADAFRGGNGAEVRPTRGLVYLLGTRTEFASRSQVDDWGILVGLTKDARNAGTEPLKALLDAIVASWNLLAVAPFAMAQAQRISSLDMQRKATHVFKTNVQFLLEDLDKGFRLGSEWDGLRPRVEKFLSLAQLSQFLANQGLNNPNAKEPGYLRQIIKSDHINKREYDIIQSVKEMFEHSCATCGVGVSFEGSMPNAQFWRWVNIIYLQSIINEVVSNIVEHSKSNNHSASCRLQIDRGLLHIVVRNELQEHEAMQLLSKRRILSRDESVNKIAGSELAAAISRQPDEGELLGDELSTGEAAARAFFNCLGGGYTGIVELFSNKIYYSAKMSCNLDLWKTLVDPLLTSDGTQKESEGKLDDIALGLTNENLSQPQINTPINESVSLRVLLLDDLIGMLDRALTSLDWINKGPYIIKHYRRKFPLSPKDSAREFECVGIYSDNNDFLGVEIVLCTKMSAAKDYLATEHFDILLVDVDFSTEEGAPTLGGLLFALIPRPDAIVRVMTAASGELRETSRDFEYLAALQEKTIGGVSIMRHLAVDMDEDAKNLRKQLQMAFFDWVCEVFPKRTDKMTQHIWCSYLLGNNSSTDCPNAVLHEIPSSPKCTLQDKVPKALQVVQSKYISEERKNKARRALATLPTAIAEFIDGAHHNEKKEFFEKYAKGELNPCYATAWDALLRESCEDITSYKCAIRKIESNGCGDEHCYDILYRKQLCWYYTKGSERQSASMKVYNMGVNENRFNVCHDNATRCVGNILDACEFTHKMRAIGTMYQGVILVGTESYRPPSGDALQDVLVKYVSDYKVFPAHKYALHIPEKILSCSSVSTLLQNCSVGDNVVLFMMMCQTPERVKR